MKVIVHRMDGTKEVAQLGNEPFVVGDQIIRNDGIAPEIITHIDGDKVTARGVLGERVHSLSDIRAY